MLKSLFSLTVLRYPSLVQGIIGFNLFAGWSLLLINGFTATSTTLLLMLTAASLAAGLLVVEP